MLFAKEMLNEQFALFLPAGEKLNVSHPNRFSAINNTHLEYFYCIGRVLAKVTFRLLQSLTHVKAIIEKITIPCYFTSTFYKSFTGKKV